MRLEYALDTRIDILGKRLELNLAFDNVLRVYDLQQNKEELDITKIEVSLQVLVRNYKSVQSLPIRAKAEILEAVFEQFITPKTRRGSQNDLHTMDFRQDAAYIYSSFMMDYGIDLFEEQGKLDWRKFIALFQGLSDRTKMREVMSIRMRKIPAATKHNADEIRALQEAKAIYALDISAEEAHNNFQRGLAQLAQILVARVKGGENSVRRKS
jgi:hypothetical protein